MLDRGGPFCFAASEGNEVANALQKLGQLEKLTRQELGQQGSHAIALGSLSKAARDRLKNIGQDDLEELYSLRISAKQRVFAIEHGSLMRVLWWDPEHSVCPSHKKNT